MANAQTWKKHRWNEAVGILTWSASLLIFVCLLTYDAFDPSWNVSATYGVYNNSVGKVGAYVADTLLQLFGYAAFLIPLPLMVIGYRKIRSREAESAYIQLAGWLTVLLSVSVLLQLSGPGWIRVANFTSGGILGMFLQEQLVAYLNVTGSLIVLGAALTLGLLLSTPLSLALLAAKADNFRFPRFSLPSLPRFAFTRRNRPKGKMAETGPQPQGTAVAVRDVPVVRDPERAEPASRTAVQPNLIEPAASPVISLKSTESKRAERGLRPANRDETFHLPRLDFLQAPGEHNSVDEAELLERAEQITQKCSEFDVRGQVEQIHPGPVVTTYEFKPEPGIKYSRLTSLVDDLCLALRAESIRIDRIPGKNTVGIEVPNLKREPITLRAIISSDAFHRSKSLLTLALGKLIHGETYVSDLRKMPHLLIAGATGSGKSVALNSMVCSMIYNARPDQVKFIMIDPKRLELGVYDGIPHLLTPIVTDPKRAANALRWAVTEMEGRYKRLAGLGVRNIDQYNAMVESNSFDPLDEETAEWMPYIVVIIDELADLMMISAKEVEESITRLAQMARAVGIHLILATQRPSVDVITGLIKANFPSRISFRVSSKVDSRTILDTNGAEQLLGLGDMLFLPPGTSRLIRVHGAFVSEKEIHNIVTFLKRQGDPTYRNEVLEDPPAGPDSDMEADEGWNDELYEEAARFVAEIGKASTSLLQRRFRIGYGRAARLIDVMERNGLVGPADGSKPREVLKGRDYYREVDERL
ncbi:MAG: DNA translocase FtsK 4TM domain-containing protein [Acidobacteria bacterium]|nr:DNA translocase FtsK 4TM domain-containing protein [Acidobacteriota bacterium]